MAKRKVLSIRAPSLSELLRHRARQAIFDAMLKDADELIRNG